MAGAIHEIAVQKILARFSQAKTRGFRKQLLAAFDPDELDPKEIQFGLVPDAYFVDAPNKTAVVFEVEGANLVSNAKMEEYCDIGWVLDDLDWDLFLVTTDRWGNQTGIVDISRFAIDKVVHDARRRA